MKKIIPLNTKKIIILKGVKQYNLKTNKLNNNYI